MEWAVIWRGSLNLIVALHAREQPNNTGPFLQGEASDGLNIP